MNPPDAQKDDFLDARTKHLALIQDVVSRMAGASAWTKRVAIIVVGGAAAVASRESVDAEKLSLLAIVLVIIFWLIDARYLRQERWFRDMHEKVAAEPHTQRPSFSLTPTKEIRDGRDFLGCAFAWSTLWYYGALALFLLLAWKTLA